MSWIAERRMTGGFLFSRIVMENILFIKKTHLLTLCIAMQSRVFWYNERHKTNVFD